MTTTCRVAFLGAIRASCFLSREAARERGVGVDVDRTRPAPIRASSFLFACAAAAHFTWLEIVNGDARGRNFRCSPRLDIKTRPSMPVDA